MITVPLIEPREYQLPVLKALDSGCKRAVLVWNRRSGKDILCINYLAKRMVQDVGIYYYVFPTYAQAKKVIWDSYTNDGKKYINFIPPELVAKKNETELSITLLNGSKMQLVGSSKVDSLVGTNPKGIIFSEYALQDPKAWSFMRPILRANDGWALFVSTPRGRNHFYDLCQVAKQEPDWFYQLLTYKDTEVVTEDDIEKERKEGMSEQMIAQEYLCSFDQGIEGSYYAQLINKAELEGRLANIPIEGHAKVDTFWDLGVSDSTVILFAQRCGRGIHIIDFYQAEGEGLQHYINVLQQKQQEHGFVYGDHYAPHDIKVREFSSNGLSRLDIARNLGVEFEIVPNLLIADGIEQVRQVFPRLYIDSNRCAHVIKCLENYHKQYDERNNVYREKPVHDWSSHIADSIRYMAIVYSDLDRTGSGMTESEAQRLERLYRR